MNSLCTFDNSNRSVSGSSDLFCFLLYCCESLLPFPISYLRHRQLQLKLFHFHIYRKCMDLFLTSVTQFLKGRDQDVGTSLDQFLLVHRQTCLNDDGYDEWRILHCRTNPYSFNYLSRSIYSNSALYNRKINYIKSIIDRRLEYH